MGRKNVRVTVVNDQTDRERMESVHKPANKVQMTGLETSECLYRAVMQIKIGNQALMSVASSKCIWHSEPRKCSEIIPKYSIYHLRGIRYSDVKNWTIVEAVPTVR